MINLNYNLKTKIKIEKNNSLNGNTKYNSLNKK